MRIAILTAVLVSLVGCTHNQTAINPDGTIAVTTSSASSSMITKEGNQSAVQHGIGASVLKQDAEGNWINMPGPLGVLTYNPKTGQLFAGSPKDAVFKGVKFTPNPAQGQPAFEADEISLNISNPIKAQTASLVAALASLEDMTQTEAEARVEQMRIAGQITADIAEILVRYFVPTLSL